MRKHLVLLIAKYCRILAAANRLKCGKKLKSSILGTLNRLRGSLARLDRAARGEHVKFKSAFLIASDVVYFDDFFTKCRHLFNVSGIVKTI